MEKKPWYKSKIIALCATALIVIGGNLGYGWITGIGVTQEQIEAVRSVQPAVADAVQDMKEGQNLLQAGGAVLLSLIAVFRAWFTPKLIG